MVLFCMKKEGTINYVHMLINLENVTNRSFFPKLRLKENNE